MVLNVKCYLTVKVCYSIVRIFLNIKKTMLPNWLVIVPTLQLYVL